MLKIKELRFSGIGRFVEEQVISFDSYGNLIQVDGLNKNTGGSSGAGKSTVFNAIDFLFGLSSYPISVLQSRYTDENIEVSGLFDYNGNNLVISRGKKLKIVINDEVTTGSAKLSEEKLDQILEIPRHLFRQIMHKKQGDKGFFLNLTPKDTNDFLTDALNLTHFNKYIDKLEVKRIDLSKIVSSLTSEKMTSEAGLTVAINSLNALGEPPTRSIDQSSIVKLKENLDAAKVTYNDLLNILNNEAHALDAQRPSVEVIPYDSTKKKAFEAQLERVRTQSKELVAQKNEHKSKIQTELYTLQSGILDSKRKVEQGKAAQAEAMKIGLELKKLKQSICPTCDQLWENEKIKAKETELLSFIEQLKSRISDGTAATTKLDENLVRVAWTQQNSVPVVEAIDLKAFQLHTEEQMLIKELSKYTEEERTFVRAQNEANKIKQVDFNARQDVMRQRHGIALREKQGQVELCDRALSIAVAQFKSYEEEKIRHKKTLESFEGNKKVLSDKLAHVDEQLTLAKLELEYTEELKRAIKSYLSHSFDEALETISENATKIIHSIPNMATATIQLQGTKETKDGRVKEEVSAQIHMDGEENVDIRSLSGGERASTDLAIDLSVMDLIESRANKGINVFLLDEPFTGLESVNIEMVLDMLKSTSLNKKLLIVDHNPIVKEQISDRIIAIRDGLISKLE